MSTKVGDIYVEMRASTASFMRGMEQTVGSAKAAASGIQSAFSMTGIPLPAALIRGVSDLGRVSFETSRQASHSFAIIGTVIGAAAIAAGAALAHVTVKAAEHMDQLGRLGEKYGLTADQMAALEYAAKLTETNVSGLSRAFGTFSVQMVNAARGQQAAVELFGRLGVKVTEAGKIRDTAAVFDEVAAKMSGMGSGAVKTADAVALFSQRGLAMIPIINRLPGGLAAAAAEARSLGLALGEEGLQNAEQFHESLKRLELGVEGAQRQFALGLLPALNSVIAAFHGGTEAGNAFRDMGETLGGVLKTIAQLTMAAGIGLAEMWLWLQKISIKAAGGAPMLALESGVEVKPEDFAEVEKDLDAWFNELQKRYNAFVADINKKPLPLPIPKPTPTDIGPSLAPKAKSDIIGKEIAQLREQLGATQALSAAELIDEAAVRQVTAANEADAIILRVKQQLKDQNRVAMTAEDEELIRSLAIKLSLAKVGEQEMASLREKTEQLILSASQYQRLADATLLSTEAVRQAMVANEMEAAADKAKNVPMAERIAMLERLRTALDAASKGQESYNIAQAALANRAPIDIYQETIAALGKQGNVLRASGKDLSGYYLAMARAIDTLKQSQDELLMRTKTFAAGAHVALRQYAEYATDAATQAAEGIGNAMRSMEDGMVNAVTSGSLKIRDIFKAMLADIVRMFIRSFVTGPLATLLGGLFGGLGALLGGGLSNNAPAFPNLHFAQGGVMTPQGPLPLRRYAFGGIATSPQLALIGNVTEAYVPLPDGRSIPVTMRGGAGGNVYVDARGADAGVEYRVMRAMQMAEARGAVRGAAMSEERRRRGYSR